MTGSAAVDVALLREHTVCRGEEGHEAVVEALSAPSPPLHTPRDPGPFSVCDAVPRVFCRAQRKRERGGGEAEAEAEGEREGGKRGRERE